MLDLARLRVLREVACHGSLTRAAAALSYTTSALSQQISVLERRPGPGCSNGTPGACG
ncbi:LysR family transcriptional regulator [Nonomuraea thailandensis]